MKKLTLLLGLMLLPFARSYAGIYEGLSAADKATLAAGAGQVAPKIENIAGAPWPKITMLQRVDATVEEAAGVFFDYASHKSFIPGLGASAITKTAAPNKHEVSYTLKMPIGADERYTTENTLTSLDGGTSLVISWKLVRADKTRDSRGKAHFERMPSGATLLVYENFVLPGSYGGLEGMLRGQAINQVRQVAQSLANEAKRRRAAGLSQQDVARIRLALGK